MADCNQLEYKGIIYTREELAQVLAGEQDNGIFNKMSGKTSTTTQLSNKSIEKINTFLEKIGVDVKTFDKNSWKFVTNNDKSRGFADTLQGIIAMVEGDERFTLGEEAAHMIVEIIEQTNPKLYKEMFNKIGQYKIFDLVLQDPLYTNNKNYQTEDKKDIQKLKKEAIGKLIAEQLARKEGNANEVDNFTYPSEDNIKQSLAREWFSKILDWLKNIFKKPGFNPFEETADYILGNKEFNNTIADVQIHNEPQHRLVNPEENLPKQTELSDKIKDINIKVVEENGKFLVNGNPIKYSFANENKSEDDFIQTYAVKEHNDIINILNRYIDENGLLRQNPLESNETPQVGRTNKPYELLYKNIGERLALYTANTKFFYNTILYNEAKSRVTKLDFLAVKPSGEVDVLTWDFMREPKKDIGKTQREASQKYLAQVKNLLREAYNVNEFGDTRSIPIILNYTTINGKKLFKGIKIGKAEAKDEIKEFLQPIPAIDEKTGNEQIDKYIQKLNSLYKTINESPVIEGRRDVKYSELNAIFSAIRNLQLTKSFKTLFSQAENQIDNTKILLNKHNEKFSGKPITDFTDLELNQEASQLYRLAEGLEIYKDIDLYFEKLFKSDDEYKDDLHSVRQVAIDARSASQNIKDVINAFVSKYIAEKRNIKNLLDAEKSVNTLDRNFRTLSQAPTKAAQTYWLIAEEFRNKAELQTQDYVERLIQIEKDIKEESKLNKSDYKKLIEKKVNGKGVNQLIDKHSSEFYTELKKQITNKNTKWIKENIDQEKFHEWLLQFKANKIKQIDESVYLGSKEDQELAKSSAKKELEHFTDISSGRAYLNYIGVKQFPIDRWLSKEYQEVQKNPKILALYNYALEINKKAKESEYLQAQKYRNFLPFIRKSITEKFVFGGSFNPIESLIAGLSINDEAAGYGNFNPLTEEIEDTIPKYFTTDISVTRKDKQGNVYQDYSDVSDDIFKNLAIYTKQVIEYEQKKNVEGLANALYFVEKNKQSLQINQFGNLIKDALQFPNESNEVNSKFFRNYLKNNLYGQKYITSESSDALLGKVGIGLANGWNKSTTWFNDHLGTNLSQVSEEVSQRNLSAVKTLDAVNRVFTLKVLGLNLASSISQFLGGNFQAFVSLGKYYNNKEFFAAELKFIGHKLIANKENIHLAMMKTFLPLGSEELQREVNKMSLSNFTKHSVSDLIMSIMRNADSVVQYANFLAMMDNAIVINGELQNVREYYTKTKEYQDRYNSPNSLKQTEKEFDAKIKELKEQYGIAKKANIVNGKLKIEGATEESIHKYRSLVQQIGKRAAGNIFSNDESQIRMNVLGRSFMMFKNWIPNLVYQRAQPLTYIAGTDSYEWGKMRMAFKHFSYGILPNIKKIYNTVYASKDGIDGLRKLYEQKRKEYFEQNNKQLEMTEAEFFDLVRQNLRSQVRDTILFISLLSMFLAVKALAPDDDEDKTTKAAYGYFVRTLDNVQQEMSFYYNPLSLQHILSGGIFPALGVLTDLTKIFTNMAQELFGYAVQDDELIDSTHPVKYIMKTFPVTKEMLNYIAIFDPETAQNMGIVINSNARK